MKVIQKIRKYRRTQKKKWKRYIEKKILCPLVYKWNCRKPVQDNKIIFMEVRLPKLSNSFQLLYDELVGNYDFNIHCHFLRTGYAKGEAYRHRCLDFARDLATAKYVIYDEGTDVAGCIKMRKETKILQTWHGCGAFKRFGFSTAEFIFGDTAKNMKKYPAYADYDCVTVSSPEVVWAYAEAMGKKDNPACIKPIGVSRTDIFYDENFIDQARKKFQKLFSSSIGKKVILYAPTFRGRSNRAETPDMLNVKMFYEHLSEEYVLVFKHHPIVRKKPSIPEEYVDFAIDLSDLMDIEELLCVADICISDYSSLVFEYSLFEKPIVFFAYDLNNYFDWRGFYYDYEELAPGPICESNIEIIDFIQHIEERFDKKRVQEFRKKFMSSCDGHSTERIMKTFFGEELSKYQRDIPIKGEFHKIPTSEKYFSDIQNRIFSLKKIKEKVEKSYNTACARLPKENKILLIKDEKTEGDIFKILKERLLSSSKYEVVEIDTFSIDNATSVAFEMATSKLIICAGEPEILRMVHVRNDSMVIQVVPEIIPLYKKKSESLLVKSGYNQDEMDIVPYKVKYDGILTSYEVGEALGDYSYSVKERAEVLNIGNLYTDVLFDEEYVKKAKARLLDICPLAKNKKIILFLCKYRVVKGKQIMPDLVKLHEYLHKDYFCLQETWDVEKNKKSVPKDYLSGFAVSPRKAVEKARKETENEIPYFSIMELIACADFVIGDYRPEVFSALVMNKPLFLWAPDFDTFINKEDLLLDYKQLMPDAFCYTEEELIDKILEPSDRKIEYISKFKDQWLHGCDGNVSNRLVEWIQDNISR